MKDDKQFVIVEFDWIMDEQYRSVMSACKGIQLVYDILRRYIVRSNNQKHKISQEIFLNYYSKNILASAVTYTHLRKMTGLSNDLLKKCIDTLEQAKYIMIDKTPTIKGEQHIYILGKVKHGVDEENQPVAKTFWLIDDAVFENKMTKLRFKNADDA